MSSPWMSLWQSHDSCQWQAYASYKTNNSQWTIIDGNVQWQKIVLRMSLIVLSEWRASVTALWCNITPNPNSTLLHCQDHKNQFNNSMERSTRVVGWRLEFSSWHHDIMPDPCHPIISAGIMQQQLLLTKHYFWLLIFVDAVLKP